MAIARVLDDLTKAAPARGLPPVHLWNPPNCGEIDIVIKANGEWLHEGSAITRPALVRLFSTVLRRDPDGVHLVTPVEKLRITVEDAPFVAVSVEADGEDLVFTTNVGERVTAGAGHMIRVETDPETLEPRPYVHVRAGLDALIARSVFYDLVERARDCDNGTLTVRSGGIWFPLGDAAKQAP
jgi:hypothetical protein